MITPFKHAGNNTPHRFDGGVHAGSFSVPRPSCRHTIAPSRAPETNALRNRGGGQGPVAADHGPHHPEQIRGGAASRGTRTTVRHKAHAGETARHPWRCDRPLGARKLARDQMRALRSAKFGCVCEWLPISCPATRTARLIPGVRSDIDAALEKRGRAL